jgi:hypothetical protein
MQRLPFLPKGGRRTHTAGNGISHSIFHFYRFKALICLLWGEEEMTRRDWVKVIVLLLLPFNAWLAVFFLFALSTAVRYLGNKTAQVDRTRTDHRP